MLQILFVAKRIMENDSMQILDIKKWEGSSFVWRRLRAQIVHQSAWTRLVIMLSYLEVLHFVFLLWEALTNICFDFTCFTLIYSQWSTP